MDLDRLQEFVSIAQNRSIKKTAEEMNLSPATLYARLNTFETSLGIVLFERKRNALTLTAQGSRFYTDACKIVNEYQQLKKELSAPEHYSFRSLRIAISEGQMPLYLGPFLDMLNAMNPHLQLQLLDDTHYSIADSLHSGQADLYFAPAMSQFGIDGITKYTYSSFGQYALLPADHRLASRESISLWELDKECFILYPKTKETCIRDFQLTNLNASGIHYTVYDSSSSPTFNHMFVTIGKGIFLSPIPILNEPPKSVCVSLTDVPYPCASSMFYLKNCTKPEVARFVAYFKRFIKEASHHENRKAL